MKVFEVLKEKKRIRAATIERRRADIKELRDDSRYRVSLQKKKKELDEVLSQPRVTSVCIKISDKNLSLFLKAMHKEEMAVYNISDLDNNEFLISRKVIFLE